MGGKFKVPFSLDETTSTINLDFVNRSRAADLLAPGRDRGVMSTAVCSSAGPSSTKSVPSSTTGGMRAGTTAAGFTATGPSQYAPRHNPGDRRSRHSAISRSAPRSLQHAAGRLPGPARANRIRSAVVSSRSWIKGQRRRVGLQLRWRPGPFSVKSEYIRLTDERLDQSVDDTDLSPFLATGWYVSGTWAITGDAKAGGSLVLAGRCCRADTVQSRWRRGLKTSA